MGEERSHVPQLEKGVSLAAVVVSMELGDEAHL